MHPINDDDLRELLPALRRFALWLARDPAAADDLVQTCMEKALSRWASRRDGDLKAWLFSILYRQFIDEKRRAKRWGRLFDAFLGIPRPDTPDKAALTDNPLSLGRPV